MDNPATVTVVTAFPGTNIGGVCAHLGRNLRDGLTIRTVVSHYVPPSGAHADHVSPSPYPPPWPADQPDRLGRDDRQAVLLHALPSAWQHPDTNLGVAYTDRPDGGLRGDLDQFDLLGLNPAHRVTVQVGKAVRGVHLPSGLKGAFIPLPVEVGDLAAQARDSVLRGSADGSRHVLIEAGDGQTFLDALATVGLPPWSEHIDWLRMWLVVDAGRPCGPSGPLHIRPSFHTLCHQLNMLATANNVVNAHIAITNIASLDRDEPSAATIAEVQRETGLRVGLISQHSTVHGPWHETWVRDMDDSA